MSEGEDWLDKLTPEERSEWDEFVDHFRRDTLHKMIDSAFVASIVPSEGWDVKFAVELGSAIMLDKPLIALIMPGANVSEKLKRVADEIVEADLDTEEGRKTIHEAISRIVALTKEQDPQ